MNMTWLLWLSNGQEGSIACGPCAQGPQQKTLEKANSPWSMTCRAGLGNPQVSHLESIRARYPVCKRVRVVPPEMLGFGATHELCVSFDARAFPPWHGWRAGVAVGYTDQLPGERFLSETPAARKNNRIPGGPANAGPSSCSCPKN